MEKEKGVSDGEAGARIAEILQILKQGDQSIQTVIKKEKGNRRD